MKSDLFSADEEQPESVDVSSGFSFGNSSEGAWLLGDSKVSYPSFCMEYLIFIYQLQLGLCPVAVFT
jgi:hypothetical protein